VLLPSAGEPGMRWLQTNRLGCLEGALPGLRVLGLVSRVGMSKAIHQDLPAGSIARVVVVPNEVISADTTYPKRVAHTIGTMAATTISSSLYLSNSVGNWDSSLWKCGENGSKEAS
jgi:hypothetical protein